MALSASPFGCVVAVNLRWSLLLGQRGVKPQEARRNTGSENGDAAPFSSEDMTMEATIDKLRRRLPPGQGRVHPRDRRHPGTSDRTRPWS